MIKLTELEQLYEVITNKYRSMIHGKETKAKVARITNTIAEC